MSTSILSWGGPSRRPSIADSSFDLWVVARLPVDQLSAVTSSWLTISSIISGVVLKGICNDWKHLEKGTSTSGIWLI